MNDEQQQGSTGPQTIPLLLRWLSVSLTLVGAILGGGFPGSLMAFFFAVATGISGSQGEAICLAVNLVLGVVGSSAGCRQARVSRGLRFDGSISSAARAGIVAGVVGYFWLDWEISHADPPL